MQLAHSFDWDKMYGSKYGYRSGLNPTMVRHLHRKVRWLEKNFPLDDGAVVVDISSNDGTLLNAYHSQNIRRIGIRLAVTSRHRAILGGSCQSGEQSDHNPRDPKKGRPVHCWKDTCRTSGHLSCGQAQVLVASVRHRSSGRLGVTRALSQYALSAVLITTARCGD